MDFSDDELMDPFDIRYQFTDMISKLTSSQQSVTNAAMFAMKHRKSYELCYEILRSEMKKQKYFYNFKLF
ncbi:hypothetical protein PIROE2DRAFT_16252 [Piromyces sp. E2]|nr:hypothetical protein PIROE2DRAFT_16252 [Piromyces sp. E2]|eukprot:OUM58462.1 hypothetical protein PIROE2DRAFT_16252 [Piromyces sp. E2]